jgi:hypothetical protein
LLVSKGFGDGDEEEDTDGDDDENDDGVVDAATVYEVSDVDEHCCRLMFFLSNEANVNSAAVFADAVLVGLSDFF